MKTTKLCIHTGWLGYEDFYFNQFSPHVATLSSGINPNHWQNGFLTYLAYSNKPAAMTALKYLLKSGLAEDVDIRKPRRLKGKGNRWELKVRGLSLTEVMKQAIADKAGQIPLVS